MLAQFTDKLREDYGDQVGGIRLRRAKRSGKEVFSILWNDGTKARSQQVKATNELEAYEAAKQFLKEVTGEVKPTGDAVPPSGLMRRTLIAALRANEGKGIRQQTEDSNARALHRVAGYISERGLLLNKESLLEAIKATDITKRERRSAIQAAKALAEAGQIALVVPKALYFESPEPLKRELRLHERAVINKTLREDIETLPPYARWMFRVVACTGVRANACFSMEIPNHELTAGASLYYVDSKRSKKNALVKAETTPSLVWDDQSMWNVWRLWEIPEEIKELQVFGRRPTNEELVKQNNMTSDAQRALRRKLPEAKGLVTMRMLRHLTVMRLFKHPKIGSDKDYLIAKIVSTSVDQLRKTYSQLYTNQATSIVGDAFDFTIRSSEDDVRRALENL
ncbi:hypothetical protein [Synechococcus sp. RS9916]|uniref:hypothetical protein n=1 Tax=Synechococcus sp. RS9916 TaxID=221359 RepID=UPI0000E536C7|nr:hypothetical protein [Synechococcus sp. RS9916]EAU74275.1 hypothetical protein RS9916_32247 [Synechococcus sp. RS9916]